MRHVHNLKTGKHQLVETSDEWKLENRVNYIELTTDKSAIIPNDIDIATITVTLKNPLDATFSSNETVVLLILEDDIVTEVPVVLSAGVGSFTITANDPGFIEIIPQLYTLQSPLKIYAKTLMTGNITTSVSVSGSAVLVPEHRMEAAVQVTATVSGGVLITRFLEASVLATGTVTGTLRADWKLRGTVLATANVTADLEVYTPD